MFKIINYSLQMSSKRKNRQKVQCQKCNDVLNSDQQETHMKTKHSGQPVKFQIYTGDVKQRKLSDVFSTPSTPFSVPKVSHDPPSPPGKPNISAIGGDFVNLSWDRPENDGGSRIKGYWVEKREIGLEIWQRVNQYLHTALQFNITNLIEGRSYEFRTFAENDIGVSQPSTNSQQVVAKDPEEPKPPEIVSPLKNISVIEEKDGKFECQVVGTPRPHVTWYKGAGELFNSGKHEISQIGTSYFLTVKSVFGEDEDTYACRASNSGGTKSTKAELKIKQPPRLDIPPRFRDSASFEKGENAVMKIPFTGNPKPSISWEKDGETVASGARFQVQTEECHSLITITDCGKDDSGPYTITASNELGTDFALINVQISDCPGAPRDKNMNDPVLKSGEFCVLLSSAEVK